VTFWGYGQEDARAFFAGFAHDHVRIVGCFVHPYGDHGVRFPITDLQPYEAAFVFDGEGCADIPVVVHQLKAFCSHPLEILVRSFCHRFLPVIAVRAYSYRRSYVTEARRVLTRRVRRSRTTHAVQAGFFARTIPRIVYPRSCKRLVKNTRLRHVADVIRRNIRQSDWLARWGGDEFVLALHDASAFATTELVLQRIVNDVKNSPARLPHGDELVLTITIGARQYSGVPTFGTCWPRRTRRCARPNEESGLGYSAAKPPRQSEWLGPSVHLD
jgi:hypothetical protein